METAGHTRKKETPYANHQEQESEGENRSIVGWSSGGNNRGKQKWQQQKRDKSSGATPLRPGTSSSRRAMKPNSW